MKAKGRNMLASLLVIGAVLGFVFGVAHLLAMRIQRGDVFEAYSSFRSDPLGTKALWESLDALPALSVRRNMEPLAKLAANPSTTLFFLGSGIGDPNHVELGLVEDLERVAASGGRVVISLIPVNWSGFAEEPDLSELMKRWRGKEEDTESEDEEKGEAPKAEKEADDYSEFERWAPSDPSDEETEQAQLNEPNAATPTAEKDAAEETGEDDADKPEGNDGEDEEGEDESAYEAETVELVDRWGLTYAFNRLPQNEDDSFQTAMAKLQGDHDLPGEVSWHTSLYFDKLSDKWRTLYARDGFPVVIERDYGSGTIVFSADSFLFSNEAMLNERHPTLLAWFVGANNEVIFDETHLGTIETPSVMALARRYRLHGVIACILVLAALFVWKNAAQFVPSHDAPTVKRGASLGRDAATGFATLLRRSIPERDLVRVCFAEWHKTFAHEDKTKGNRTAQVEPILAGKDPVAAYRAVCEVLTERKGKP